jgi:hypothetical protein
MFVVDWFFGVLGYLGMYGTIYIQKHMIIYIQSINM